MLQINQSRPSSVTEILVVEHSESIFDTKLVSKIVFVESLLSGNKTNGQTTPTLEMSSSCLIFVNLNLVNIVWMVYFRKYL